MDEFTLPNMIMITKKYTPTVADRATFVREGISNDDIAALVSLDPVKTAYSLWQSKTATETPEGLSIEERHEQCIEAIIADALEGLLAPLTLIKGSVKETWFVAKDSPVFRCRPSRLFRAEDETIVPVIIIREVTEIADALPNHWALNAQYTAGVMGAQQCVVAWMSPSYEVKTEVVTADASTFEWLVNEVTAWWNEYIVGGETPAEVQAVEDAYDAHIDGQFIEATEDVRDIVVRLSSLLMKRNVLDTSIANLREDVMRYMMQSEGMTFGGSVIATWRSPKVGRFVFDEDAFKRDHADLYKQYLTKTAPRAFRLWT